MDPLQQLEALQNEGTPGQVKMATAGGPGGRLSSMNDPLMQLQALLTQGATTGMSPRGQNPMAAALGLMLGNAGMTGTGRGPATDGELYDMAEANQAMRGNLPIKPMGMDMTGFSDDVQPMDDIRQTPYSETDETIGLDGQDRGFVPSKKKGGSPSGMPSFSGEGKVATGSPSGMPRPYGLGKRATGSPSGMPMSTEQELEMVSNKMGSGDPSEDGTFPTQKELDALNSGKISPAQFDAKWGKGAAKEMMENNERDRDKDGDIDADDD